MSHSIELDEETWNSLLTVASSSGQSPDEIARRAIENYLTLDELLEQIWERQPNDGLSEAEALRLAYSELDAARAERTKGR